MDPISVPERGNTEAYLEFNRNFIMELFAVNCFLEKDPS